jgi:hypothetical protein
MQLDIQGNWSDHDTAAPAAMQEDSRMFAVIFEANPHPRRREDDPAHAALPRQEAQPITTDARLPPRHRFDATQAGTGGMPGWHHATRIIRNDGRVARDEARHAYPPVQSS